MLNISGFTIRSFYSLDLQTRTINADARMVKLATEDANSPTGQFLVIITPRKPGLVRGNDGLIVIIMK